jgi:hypothetical protein
VRVIPVFKGVEEGSTASTILGIHLHLPFEQESQVILVAVTLFLSEVVM